TVRQGNVEARFGCGVAHLAPQQPEERSAIDRRVCGVSLSGHQGGCKYRKPLDGRDHRESDLVLVIEVQAYANPRQCAQIPDAVKLPDVEVEAPWEPPG